MPVDRQKSVRKDTKNALERITAIEESIPQIIQGTNSGFSQVENKIQSVHEVVAALVSMLGEAEVSAVIASTRTRRSAEEAVAQKANVTSALASGELVVADVIGEDSLIVGVESDKDGTPVGVGRTQLQAKSIKPEFKVQLVGKGVGTTFIVNPDGGKFLVTEIYTIVAKKPTVVDADVIVPDQVCPADGCVACDDPNCKKRVLPV